MIGAIICGIIVMVFIVVSVTIAAAVHRMDQQRDRLDTLAPKKPQPWTVKPVGTPMLADYGIDQMYHVYDSAGHHACGADFCYLTRAKAEAAARLGERFTAVVLDGVGQQ